MISDSLNFDFIAKGEEFKKEKIPALELAYIVMCHLTMGVCSEECNIR
jgi:hypothetical protein